MDAADLPPLLVSIVFHPDSGEARDIALAIHRALNADTLVPGLRIPTAFCPGDGHLPGELPLGLAQRHCVVVLADATLDAREPWSGYVGDLYETCEAEQHRFLPFQLTDSAYPLDPRLKGLNFARAYTAPETERAAFVIRQLAIEVCRFLAEEPAGLEQPVPLTVFLSHAKGDLSKPPHAARTIIEHLKADQPVKAWVDSGEIEAGSKFADKIEDGVRDAALLCVLTDSYASRAWCRREVLLAKQHQRPVVVVDALHDHEVRSFPYLGNVPVVHWNGDPTAAVGLLIKENLHHLHTRQVLERWRARDDEIFVRPPELATLATLPAEASVLYPDPPLGREEIELLKTSGRTATTPLQRLAEKRPLDGKQIALSLSEPTDIRRRGLEQVHFDDLVLDMSRYLLIEGATLAYGGHLGSEGYTVKLAELIATYNQRDDLDPIERLVNYVGWPVPRPTDKEASERKKGCKLEIVARPDDIDESLDPGFVASPSYFPADSLLRRFAWARGMTAMRQHQTDRVLARIVVGGVFGPTHGVAPDGAKTEKWYMSRIPGVLEEIVLSIQADQPVFLVGAFGGIAGLVADVLTDPDHQPESLTWDYQRRAPHAEGLPKMYADRGLEWLDYPEILALLRSRGVAKVNPLLSEEENRELFVARDPMRIVELILRGLARLP